MRAVGKVVGVGIDNANARGAQSTSRSAEHSIIRVAAPPSASSPIAVSSVGVPSVRLTTASANQKASLEHVDDWELSGGIVEHEVALEGSSDASGQGEPIAGVLFGGVPSLEEAKEAIADLKDALDMVYLSPPPYGDTARDSAVSLVSNPEETSKGCASAPKPAIQAFKLLSESADVQSVVSSIVADPNVRNAVLNNSAYMDFIQYQAHCFYDEFEVEESTEGSESPVKLEEYYEEDSKDPSSGYLHKIKTSVVELASEMVGKAIKPAIQAVKLLSESPAVQCVVASIAADGNVWNAVMNNPAFMAYMQSQQTSDEFKVEGFPKKLEEYEDSEDPSSGFMQKMKSSVVEMVKKTFDFSDRCFTDSTEKEGIAGLSLFYETTVRPLMGFAVKVIIIILLKRHSR
ncbi:hypothetical protein ES332_D11G342900v1 [Gossypium tomentosum]|uniref:Uncharacterized protein n=1 Tax=Gossypium tomentosum TaxID=34277 RepID=A0A5D2IVS8_GOSTO|nr:hypothetical protein ES332_D11G342900v1 [Gossypium tomentosum]